MVSYYVTNLTQVGYIVAQLDKEEGWYIGCRYVCNFGNHSDDATAFCDDCNNGLIDIKRITQLMDNYTDTPYKYLGKGKLKTQTRND